MINFISWSISVKINHYTKRYSWRHNFIILYLRSGQRHILLTRCWTRPFKSATKIYLKNLQHQEYYSLDKLESIFSLIITTCVILKWIIALLSNLRLWAVSTKFCHVLQHDCNERTSYLSIYIFVLNEQK